MLENRLVAVVPPIVQNVCIQRFFSFERRDHFGINEEILAHSFTEFADGFVVAAGIATAGDGNEAGAEVGRDGELGKRGAQGRVGGGGPGAARDREGVVLAEFSAEGKHEGAPVVGGGGDGALGVHVKHLLDLRVDGRENDLRAAELAGVGLGEGGVPRGELHRREHMAEDGDEVLLHRQLRLVRHRLLAAVRLLHETLANLLEQPRPQKVHRREVGGLRVEEAGYDTCCVAGSRVRVEQALALHVLAREAERVRILLRHEVASRREEGCVQHARACFRIVVANVVDALALGLESGVLGGDGQLDLNELLGGGGGKLHVLDSCLNRLLLLRSPLVDDHHQQRLAIRLWDLHEGGSEVAGVNVHESFLAALEEVVCTLLGWHGSELERSLLRNRDVLVTAPIVKHGLDNILDLVDEGLHLPGLLHHVRLLLCADAGVLDEHAQPEAGRQQQVARECRELRVEQPLDLVAPNAREHNVATQIEPATARAPCHLPEVHSVEEDRVAREH
mmetsp:Transcript_1910/g.3939  ORF Transcript_1910/g.3939 Transcript_1910/m.3939 type:complete len:506 (+) Transcript_1910:537-2054(+)